jgi:hypothetical protein
MNEIVALPPFEVKSTSVAAEPVVLSVSVYGGGWQHSA